MSTETEAVRRMLGRMSADTDDRLEVDLARQVHALVEFATSMRMDAHRSVPVRWDDTDILICNVLCKLVDRIEELETANQAWFDKWERMACEYCGSKMNSHCAAHGAEDDED
jgi:hypothetical protein